MTEITSGCNVQSYQPTCYSKLSWHNRAWYANTKDKEQNSLNELIPKINRKHGSINASMASDMTDSDMAGTTVSRHVGELVPLTTEQYMAWKCDQQQEDMLMKLNMARSSSQHAWNNNNNHGNIELNVNSLTTTLFSKFGAR